MQPKFWTKNKREKKKIDFQSKGDTCPILTQMNSYHLNLLEASFQPPFLHIPAVSLREKRGKKPFNFHLDF